MAAARARSAMVWIARHPLARPLALAASHRLLVIAGAVLLGGIGVSIATTTDDSWWRTYFSALGTFADFSGAAFNVTLITTGLLITLMVTRVHSELKSLVLVRGRRPSRIFIGLLGSTGIHLTAIGVVPINVNQFLHERAASGVMLSFLSLLVTVFFLRRHVPAALRRATYGAAGALAVAIPIFVMGIMNLAAFEVIGFALIFGWLSVLSRSIGRLIRELDADEPEILGSDDEQLPVRTCRAARGGSAAPASRPAAILRLRPAPRPEPARAQREILHLPADRVPVRRTGDRTPDRCPRPVQRGGQHAALWRPPRGCTGSAARAGSARSTTPARRSPRSPAAAR